jgi:hypothetical protein
MKLLFGALSISMVLQPHLIEKSEIIINSHHPLQSLKKGKNYIFDVNWISVWRRRTWKRQKFDSFYFSRTEGEWWSNNWIFFSLVRYISVSLPLPQSFFNLKCLNIFKFLLFIDIHSSWHLKFLKWNREEEKKTLKCNNIWSLLSERNNYQIMDVILYGNQMIAQLVSEGMKFEALVFV